MNDNQSQQRQNPFFLPYNTPHDTVPFDRIRLEDYEEAFMEGIRRDNEQIEKTINNPEKPTFDNTIIDKDDDTEGYYDLLERVSTVFFNLLSAETNDDMDALAQKMQPILTQHANDVRLNERLFERIKYVHRHHRKLTPEEKMLLENTYQGFVRSGALLDKEGKERLRKLTEEASMLSLQFSQNLLKENKAYTLHIADPAQLDGLPQTAIDAADGNLLNDEGYTNLEVYLNSLVAEITEKQNEGGQMMGGEPVAATELEVSGMTSYDNWTFAGGLKITGTSGTPATGNASTIKFSSNKTYTIVLPADVTIDEVTIYGYGNADGKPIYLAELAGKDYGETDYVFPARDANPASATYVIKLDNPVKDKLTFTPKGDAQACLWLKMHVASTSSGIKTVNTAIRSNNTIYTISGQRVQQPVRRGLYIINGKKIIVN